MKRNPPWVDNILMEQCAGLATAAKARKLPLPLQGDVPCKPAKELGCGSAGCVLETTDPKIVLKVTRDEEEVHIAAASMELIRRGAKLKGVVKFHGAMAVGRYFLIWRENVQHVGQWEKLIGRSSTECDRAIGALSAAALETWDIAKKMRRSLVAEDYWRWTNDVWQQAHGRSGSFRQFNATIACVSRLRAGIIMAKNRSDHSAYGLLMRTWLEYLDHGIVVNDLYEDNTGTRDGQLIMVDPGAITILNPELSNLPVEVLRR